MIKTLKWAEAWPFFLSPTQIVAEEFEEQEGKWKKFGALLAGIVIVGAITLVTEGWEH
jgi:hypothetical protein